MNNLESLFVNYEQALKLKSMGFDEPCLAFYDGKNTESFYFNNIRDASGDYIPFQKHDRLKWFGAPLKQQAFRWFRDKHDIDSHIEKYLSSEDAVEYFFMANDEESINFETYEEAESACIDKLIEIIKNK